MIICKEGHTNQAGGCCCPQCGNTCGYHPEYKGLQIPIRGTLFIPKDSIKTAHSLKELADLSPEWQERLKGKGD